MLKMQFKPVFFKDKIRIINPAASLCIITLWSRINYIYSKLLKAGVDLSEGNSKIAAMGNLYGEGLRFLLRNLLYNPQIDTLLLLGKDSSGSSGYLYNFFNFGIEAIGDDITYKCLSINKKANPVKIIGTKHVMDNLVRPSTFSKIPEIVRIEGTVARSIHKAVNFINDYTSEHRRDKRIFIEAPEVKVKYFPSNIRAHTIIKDTPVEAWKHLVYRIFKFGQEVFIAKGKRRELQNVKVVIEKPQIEDDKVITENSFDPESFRKYQKTILSSDLQMDKDYTYGHRIRAYFGIDCLDTTADSLKKGLDDRNCYITTWDNKKDITAQSRPCLVSLFFRKEESLLHLTSSFRTHNASSAWLENVYGLIAIQNYVCRKTNLHAGAITVFSHSISIDPKYLEKVQIIHDQVEHESIQHSDPNGHFVITADSPYIILKHWHGTNIINEYKAKKPEKIQHMLYKSCAISDINHAIYIGRQLQKAFQCIKQGLTYIQD